ncbi:hypothetical protein GcM3_140008, partial [Golovinomyces cichoracearum]
DPNLRETLEVYTAKDVFQWATLQAPLSLSTRYVDEELCGIWRHHRFGVDIMDFGISRQFGIPAHILFLHRWRWLTPKRRFCTPFENSGWWWKVKCKSFLVERENGDPLRTLKIYSSQRGFSEENSLCAHPFSPIYRIPCVTLPYSIGASSGIEGQHLLHDLWSESCQP